MSNMKRLSACALGIVLACSTPAALSQWVEQGPGPTLDGQAEGMPGNPVSGAVSAIAVDRAHPGIVYLATVNGGVWKSWNANSAAPAWTPLTDLKLPALSMSSIAISPLSPSTIFAGTGSMSSDALEGSAGFGVIRSTDGGRSWSILAGATFAGRRINSIVPTAVTAGGLARQVVLAATLMDGGGVYRSTNGGASFARISGSAGLPDGGVSSLVADPTSPQRLYAGAPGAAGAADAAGVFRSDNAGASWHAITPPTADVQFAHRILLSVGRSTGVLYAMVIRNDDTLSGVFRSANGGASWTAMGVPSPAIFPGAQGGLHGAIAADPVNPNVVYVSGDRQDLPNDNGCANFSANTFRGDASLASPWQNVVCNGAGGTSPHADSRYMEFDAYGNLLQANDGGIYRLEDPNLASRRWVSLNASLRPAEMHSAAFDSVSHTALGGTQDTGTTMQGAPGSRTWHEFIQGDGGVVAVDDKSGGGGSSIRYTSYQGLGFFNRSTWSPSNTLVSGPTQLALQIVSGPGAGQDLFQYDFNIQFYNPYVLNRVDPNRMLLGTVNIYESRDRGDTLADLYAGGKFISSLSYGGRFNGAPRPEAFYVGTSGPGRPYILHRRGSGGAVTELAAYPGSGVRSLVMDPQNIMKVYVVDDNDRVWESCDEGRSWSNITANLPRLLGQARTIELFSPDASGRNSVLLVGGLGGAVQMPHPGTWRAIWSMLGSGLPHGLVRDLRYNYRSNVLVAGILGRGAWTLTNFFTGWHGGPVSSDAATADMATADAATAGAATTATAGAATAAGAVSQAAVAPPGVPTAAPVARPAVAKVRPNR